MYRRIFQAPERESFFLFGPRGTGKTTWLKSKYPHAFWVDLLDPRVERRYSMHPEFLREEIEATPPSHTVVVDEIQKVPKLLDVIHSLIENHRGLQFILTGSSSRKLRRGGVNLLAGRALWRRFHPFIAGELGQNFCLETALTTGLIPLIWDAEDPNEKLEAYVDLYLQEEVKAEALVRNVGDFSRFLHAMAYAHASVLNLSNIARECQVARKTLDQHLQILEDLLLGYTIPVFEKRAKRATSSHPKFYFFDPGVFRILRHKGFLDRSKEIDGLALEGLVAEHLRTWIDVQRPKTELFFWRTQSGLEVDFIVYGPNHFYAVEVKNGHTISPGDLRGLKEIRSDYHEITAILLYRGQEILRRDGIWIMPAETFLKELNPLSPHLINV